MVLRVAISPKINACYSYTLSGTGGGATYIRWGRTTCPSTEGTELVYAGIASGAHYTNTGGPADYLCLPNEPEYLEVTAGIQDVRGRLYGVEYQILDIPPALVAQEDHNAPCAVCFVTVRKTKLMIPARISCPSSWTLEYYGYLMSSLHDQSRTSAECIDVNPENLPGTGANTNGALFYFIESLCIAEVCPSYVIGNELTCVVCTK